MKTNPLNRREFLRNTALLGAGLVSIPAVHIASAADTPPDKIVIGVMGLGRGGDLARGFLSVGADVRYLCDVDESRIGKLASAIETRSGTKPKTVTDFRRILDDPAVQALAVAAPDHWHAPATILACAAGKHVYCEKPCSHNPREGELAIAAARKHNRVVQHGTQRRSWNRVVEAIGLVRSGKLGRVLFSKGWYTNARGPTGKRTPALIPAGLNWSLWQGPAPEREFTDNVIHYKWHWYWHWGTGECGNNGVHSLDLCRWGLGVDYPRRVTSGGGRYYFNDDQETPDTQVVAYDFGDKAITWECRSCVPFGVEGTGFGAAFYGEAGTLITDGSGYVLYDTKGKQTAKVVGNSSDGPHLRNFLDCIRSGNRPVADIEEAHKSALLCHLANISHRVGRAINLDPQTHRITGDAEAAALWSREYRKGWEPQV